ncbi:hypothetical protein LCGC14_2193130 [marine sediment metagenome]|uniref:Uncharacterized protein n=1 Tax=marine sediment metagenome TaxID=412755 RepID=A0A0F9GEN5_9ZZZZ
MLITLYVGYQSKIFEERTFIDFDNIMETAARVIGSYTVVTGTGGYIGDLGNLAGDPIKRIEFSIEGRDPLDIETKLAMVDTTIENLKRLYKQDTVLKTTQYNVLREAV